MKYRIGEQYGKDDNFKSKARRHQSKFRAEILQVDYDEYGNRLVESDAKKGLNFYQGLKIFEEVKRRYPIYSKGLYADMLRSEHIPFNIFAPLKIDLELATSVLSPLLENKIFQVTNIMIEYAPSPNYEYLNDRTAFDVYVEYLHEDKSEGIIGIEVKYTEHEYKLKTGSKEEQDVNNPDSLYYQLTEKINLYKPEKLSELPKDTYRQVWRNQLLGESILQKPDSSFKHFASLLLYPDGNSHFKELTNEYSGFLLPNEELKFAGITFERLFEIIEAGISDKEWYDWVSYLRSRYLISSASGA
ncbi:MAG: hypothetical protein ACE5IY_06510 [bacterium]